eukprot:12305287-Prorocentrum_lima.AAC.1
MTSSLVGSEMCIRDRPTKPPRGTPMLPRWSLIGPPYVRPRRRTMKATVSYTHLTLPTICSV